MSRISSSKPVAISVSTAAVASVVVVGASAQPAAADSYPSWQDVQNAKNNQHDKQAMIDQINKVLSDLQAKADKTGEQALGAGESALQAQGRADDAQAKLDDLDKQIKQAQATSKESRTRAGLLAAQMARSGGNAGQLSLFLSGNNADQQLKILATSSDLTADAQATFQRAQADMDAVQKLKDQADVAKKERDKAAADAKAAYASAQDLAAQSTAALNEQQQHQEELYSQLAVLKNTTAQIEQQYAEGVQARRDQEARDAAARKAAQDQAKRDAAARAAAAAAAAQNNRPASNTSSNSGSRPAANNSGSSSSSGSASRPSTSNSGSSSHTGSSSSSGSSSNSGSSSGRVGAPNASAVDAVIAYAKAQLGEPYVLGGAGPNQWDCSGLTMRAYGSVGIGIGGHGSSWQYNYLASQGKLVPFSQRRAGDLIFWQAPGEGIYHVAISLGGNMMIAAPKPGDVVKIQSVWGVPMAMVGRPTG